MQLLLSTFTPTNQCNTFRNLLSQETTNVSMPHDKILLMFGCFCLNVGLIKVEPSTNLKQNAQVVIEYKGMWVFYLAMQAWRRTWCIKIYINNNQLSVMVHTEDGIICPKVVSPHCIKTMLLKILHDLVISIFLNS